MGKGDDPNCGRPEFAVAMVAPDAAASPAVPGKRRRGRRHPQHQLLAVMQQLLDHPLPEREPLPDAQRFLDAHLFSRNGITVVAGSKDGEYDALICEHHFKGRLVDDQGNDIGYTESLLEWGPDNRLTVRGELLRIRDDSGMQGRGFGRAYQQHLAGEYLRMGIHRKRICAIEHGAYVWATPDTIFDPEYSHSYPLEDEGLPHAGDLQWRGAVYANDLWRKYGPRLEVAQWQGVITRDQYHKVRRAFATVNDLRHPTRWRSKVATPWQVLQIGRDDTFKDLDGRDTWLGKYFLVGEMSKLYEDGCHGRGLAWQGIRLLG